MSSIWVVLIFQDMFETVSNISCPCKVFRRMQLSNIYTQNMPKSRNFDILHCLQSQIRLQSFFNSVICRNYVILAYFEYRYLKVASSEILCMEKRCLKPFQTCLGRSKQPILMTSTMVLYFICGIVTIMKKVAQPPPLKKNPHLEKVS